VHGAIIADLRSPCQAAAHRSTGRPCSAKNLALIIFETSVTYWKPGQIRMDFADFLSGYDATWSGCCWHRETAVVQPTQYHPFIHRSCFIALFRNSRWSCIGQQGYKRWQQITVGITVRHCNFSQSATLQWIGAMTWRHAASSQYHIFVRYKHCITRYSALNSVATPQTKIHKRNRSKSRQKPAVELTTPTRVTVKYELANSLSTYFLLGLLGICLQHNI